MLGTPRAVDLADGKVHTVRIMYASKLLPVYFEKLVASDSLVPFLKDNGEQKRLGTLLVFVDDGILADDPILVLPINLSVLLDLPSDKAYVGLTASTGKYWEKHDIIKWYWCDSDPCLNAKNADFDFHQSGNISVAKIRQFPPGHGFGGSDGLEGYPTQMQNPDSSPWKVAVNHLSLSRNKGLAADASEQVPGKTLYR